MIEINGYKFAEKEKEFSDSLFSLPTCSGYAKVTKRSIVFYNLQKKPIAFANAHGVIGRARETEEGIWHSYGEPPFLEEYKEDFKKRYEIKEVFFATYAKGRDHKGYFFK